MEQKPSPEVIKRIIGKLEKPSQQSQTTSGQRTEGEKVQVWVKEAVEKAAQDPEATQG